MSRSGRRIPENRPLLLVDGYNILGAWREVEKKGWGFEESRDRLLSRLVDYAGFRGCEVILVFDGHQSERKLRSQDRSGDVTVVYTKHGETADQYIEAIAGQHPKHRPLTVATSDGLEQTLVLGRGAARMSARELLMDIREARTQTSGRIARQDIKRNTLDSHLTPQQLEQLEKLRRQ